MYKNVRWIVSTYAFCLINKTNKTPIIQKIWLCPMTSFPFFFLLLLRSFGHELFSFFPSLDGWKESKKFNYKTFSTPPPKKIIISFLAFFSHDRLAGTRKKGAKKNSSIMTENRIFIMIRKKKKKLWLQIRNRVARLDSFTFLYKLSIRRKFPIVANDFVELFLLTNFFGPWVGRVGKRFSCWCNFIFIN